MKILHVLDHSIPLHSGYSFRTRAILEQQQRRGWETWQVTSPKQGHCDQDEEWVDGFQFFRSPQVTSPWDQLPAINQLAVVNVLSKRLEEVAREVRPDVLHAHSPALNGLAALRVGRRLEVPVVYEIRAFWEDAAVDHGTTREGSLRYRLTRALETYVVRRVHAVTTICEGLRTELVARGIPSEKVSVIPNAVDPERFSMEHAPAPELAEQLGLEGKRVLGFIGSFYAYEGIDLLLKALPAISARHPDVRVLLVGGGPQEDTLRRLVAESGISDRVIFTGRVAHEQIQRYYDLVDVFVYPRLAMRLTDLVTPLKPLEAMAQGKLVLASDVGGHRELIQPGETGELFRPGDPEALADAVDALFLQEQDWSRRRAAARAFVEHERSWQSSVARYEEIYQRLAGSQHARVSDGVTDSHGNETKTLR